MSKDSTRSIRLDGDVSEIAQKLANDKMLSHTLSKLLRQHYGLNTEIDAIKTRLNQTINERMLLQEEEILLADKIDELESQFLQKQTNELPKLREKLDTLLKMHSKTRQEHNMLPSHMRGPKKKQLETQGELIDKLSEEIAKLE